MQGWRHGMRLSPTFVRGLVSLAVAGFLLTWPSAPATTLALAFGTLALIDAAAALHEERLVRVLGGVLAGTVALATLRLETISLSIVAGMWALAAGISELLRAPKADSSPAERIAAALLATVGGLSIAFRPSGSAALELAILAMAGLRAVVVVGDLVRARPPAAA